MDGPSAGATDNVLVTAPVTPTTGRATRADGRAAMAAWLGLLMAIVGLAVAGRLTEPDKPLPRAAAIEFALPTADATPEPTASEAAVIAAPELIVLASPAEAGVTITTSELFVLGYLRDGVETVRVTLEARGNRIIDDATIAPARARDDGPTGSRLPRFEVRFGLPNPRPNGRMIVQVAAYAEDGRLLDVVRRPFRVGALTDGAGA